MKLLVWNINALVSDRAAAIGGRVAGLLLPPPPQQQPLIRCHPLPVQAPTARNAVLKYGSWAGFFQQHGLDLLALQVGRPLPIAIMLAGRRFAACCCTPSSRPAHAARHCQHVVALQTRAIM